MYKALLVEGFMRLGAGSRSLAILNATCGNAGVDTPWLQRTRGDSTKTEHGALSEADTR